MSQFSIQLAENRILVDALFDSTKEFCKEYLCGEVGGGNAVAEAGEYRKSKPDITVAITPQDIEYEKQKSAEEDAAMGIPTRPFKNEYLETLAVYRKICDQMPERDTFLFHCSAVAADGKAYLFTAPSGTGKSTHTRLWREMFGERAVMINDDKPLLKVVRCATESCNGTPVEGSTCDSATNTATVLVYGTPWDGKHRLSTNTVAPVAGICLLERGEENCVERIAKEDAFPRLLQQTYRPQSPVELMKTMELLDAVASNVPLCRLRCNMEPEAARVAFEGMNTESKGEVL